MITISVNSNYGIQTGDFGVTFTATRSSGNVMNYVAVVGDEEFEGTATSGEETSFTVSNFEDLVSVNNTITLTVSYNDDVATAEIAFMKFVPPVIIPKNGDYAGEISGAGSFYINVKDVLSPVNSGWYNTTGILVWGYYLDQVDDQHRLPVSGGGVPLEKRQVKTGKVISDYVYPNKSQISIGQHTIYCVVGMMRSGDTSTFNKDDPWKYDTYALVQKAITVDNFSQNFNWITPKTNWIYGEGLGHTDYNRIKNNLLYLHNRVNTKFRPFEFPDLGNDKVVTDYYYAEEFNALEDELEAINEHSVEFDIGTKQTFYQLGKFIGYMERNRIENAILELKDYVWYAIPIPYLIAPLVYSGQILYPQFYGNGGYNKSGDTSGSVVGTYTTTFTLQQDYLYWVDGTTDPITLEWTIDPCPVYVPTVAGKYTYNGNTQEVLFDNCNTQAITLTGELSGRNVGTYTVTASLNDNYVWVDGTTEDITIEWTIDAYVVTIPYIKPYEYIYSGQYYRISDSDIEGWNSALMTRSDADDPYEYLAGTYTFSISLRDTNNYVWSDGTITPKEYQWTIQRAVIAYPTISGTYVFNDATQTVRFDGLDTNLMHVAGEYTAYHAGTYTPIVVIDSGNYKFADGTLEHSYSWVIERSKLTIPTIIATTYTGNQQEAQFNNFNASYMTKGGTYQATNAGSYTVYVDIFDNDYQFSDETLRQTYQWVIAKAEGFVDLSKTIVVLGLITQDTIQVLDSSGNVSVARKSSSYPSTLRLQNSIITIGQSSRTANTDTISVIAAETTNYNRKEEVVTIKYGIPIENYQSLAYKGSAKVKRSNGQYMAIFAGGESLNTSYDTVETISNNLTRSVVGSLHAPLRYSIGVNNDEYTLFGAGLEVGSTSVESVKVVDVFDNNLTHSYADDFSMGKRQDGDGTCTSKYFIFGFDNSSSVRVLEIYDNSTLTHSSIAHIDDYARATGSETSITNVGRYAIFRGYHSGRAPVYTLNESLTVSELAQSGHLYAESPVAFNLGGYAMFASQDSSSDGYDNGIDVYNSSLTHIEVSGRMYHSGQKNNVAIVDNIAIIPGNGQKALASINSSLTFSYDVLSREVSVQDWWNASGNDNYAIINNIAYPKLS